MNKENAGGIKIVTIVGFFLLGMLLAGQTMSFIDYDLTVKLGLQESAEAIGERGIAMNKGFGVGDTVVYIPILVIGLIGIMLRKQWGMLAMAGAMAITAYWPVTCLFILIFSRGLQGFNFDSFLSYTIILTVISLYGIWALLYLHRKRHLFG